MCPITDERDDLEGVGVSERVAIGQDLMAMEKRRVWRMTGL
jgi:hypothetical protein